MTFRVLAIVIGPIWAACGLVLAISPPLDGRRGQMSPGFGVLLVVVGVVMVAAGTKSLGTRHRRPRHARGETDRRGVRIFALGGCATLAAGGLLVWAGFDEGKPALVSLGVVTMSAGAFTVPMVRDSLGSRR